MALGTLGIGEQINGVNLGNWLVLEKWMKPGIFAASGEADEIWLHRSTESAELEALLTRHRDTYITEADFRNIAAHGCNLVRIPVPYFIFGDVSGHPGCTSIWTGRSTGLSVPVSRFLSTCTRCPAHRTDSTTAASPAWCAGIIARERSPMR